MQKMKHSRLLCANYDRFLAGKIEEGNICYINIGFQITQNTDGIKLDHSMYMEKLDHPHIEPQRESQKQEQLNAEEQKLYCKLVGQLNWAVQGSRPDLAFELVDLSTKLKGGSVADLLQAIKNIGKLKDIRPVQLFPSFKRKIYRGLGNICVQ